MDDRHECESGGAYELHVGLLYADDELSLFTGRLTAFISHAADSGHGDQMLLEPSQLFPTASCSIVTGQRRARESLTTDVDDVKWSSNVNAHRCHPLCTGMVAQSIQRRRAPHSRRTSEARSEAASYGALG